MTRRNIAARALVILLLTTAIFQLSACRADQRIVSVEVVRLPYKMTYVAGVDDALDMAGCVIRIRERGGHIGEISYYEEIRATARHRINFSVPGEYEVRFYWGIGITPGPSPPPFHVMTVEVVASD